MWGKVATSLGSAIAGEVAVNLVLNNNAFNKDVKSSIKNTESAFGGSFKKIGGFIATAFATGVVVKFAKTAVNAASQTQAAWTGLNSILTGTGKSFAEGKEFIDNYINDGLIPLQNAVTSYKNLASRGYSTEQIEQTMTALKDAAAFGRQASYSYGDAIQTATEGLKNENSILVDNAGVTKNVAKMWDDYAKSIGTTANNLTQQQKIQAEVNGIMQETKFQVGDATAYANTFAGKVAKINTAFYNFKVAVGKFVAPIAELFLPYIEMALNALTKFFNKMSQVLAVFGLKMPDVISKSSSSIASLGSDAVNTANDISGTGDAATSAAKKIKKAFGNLDEINVLSFGQSASGGSTGGTGSTGGNTTTTDTTDIVEKEAEVSPAISKIADKLKALVEPLKKIDFTNLVTAFDRLKEAATPLTKKLFEGLEWLWFEILVPATKWTIEDFIPSFLYALAGALDFLGGVIDFVKPYGIWLWEEFLLPIYKWTGGKIVDVLTWIGDKLSIIGKWLTDNAPEIEKVRKDLEPFSKLISEIWKFLGNILGLAWDAFSKSISDLYKYALKPLWDYILYPLISSYWSKFSGLASILGGIFEALNKLMEGDWKGAGESIWNGLKDGLTEIWEGSFVKKYLYDPIVGGFKKLFGINSPSTVFADFGENLIEGLWNGISSMKNWFIEKWNTVKTWFKEISPSIKVKWADTKESISKKWNELTANVKDKTANLRAKVATKWSDIKKSWTNITDNIKDKTANMRAKVSTTWSSLKSSWNNLMNNFKDKTVKINATVSTVKDSISSWINEKLVTPLNKAIKWTGLSIPKLANGGVFAPNSPRLAIVGDNKRETEIVTPESKIYDQVQKALNDTGGGIQQLELTIYHKYEDGRTIIQKINNQTIKDGKVTLMT